MEKQQTFITVLEDAAGGLIDFERWDDKRAATVCRKVLELYNIHRPYHFLYKQGIERAASLAIYPTPDGYHKAADPVKRYARADLLQLIIE